MERKAGGLESRPLVTTGLRCRGLAAGGGFCIAQMVAIRHTLEMPPSKTESNGHITLTRGQQVMFVLFQTVIIAIFSFLWSEQKATRGEVAGLRQDLLPIVTNQAVLSERLDNRDELAAELSEMRTLVNNMRVDLAELRQNQ